MSKGGFFRPSTPQEVCGLLAEHGRAARLMAGGTDLMVEVNKREFNPEALIFLAGCGLNYIKAEGDRLLIGAATPFARILESEAVKEKAPLLAAAVSQIASPAIRNAGTIGGNLGTASPAADSAPPLLALGASVKIVSKNSERVVPLAEFFTGPRTSVLGDGELIAEIQVPVQKTEAGWAYRKLGKRKAQTLSIVSVAVYCPREGGKVQGARIALGAVAPTPILALEAAGILEGQALGDEVISRAAEAAAQATSPIDDMRGTAWYRKRAGGALVKQLLNHIAAQ